MEKLIAYCGNNCAECEAYLAWKNNDQVLREKAAAEWSDHTFTFTPETINCSSCKGDGGLCSYCSECEVRKCASEKGVATCGDCIEIKTCKIYNDLLEMFPNLQGIFELK